MRHCNAHADVEYKCEACEKIFSDQNRMYIHCAVNHGEKPRKKANATFICDICSKIFKTKSSIKNHLYLHISKKNLFFLKRLNQDSIL